MIRTGFIGVLVIGLSGCNIFQGNSTIGPSRIDSLINWKPCVTVQNPGFQGTPVFDNQMRAVLKLRDAGQLVWMRLGGANLRGDGLDYALEARRMGLKTIGIIRLVDLENNPRGWEDTYDSYRAIYGSNVDIWQIGGEIQNGDPSVNLATMTPEQYVPKLANLYNHIKQRYPSDVITSAPNYGSVPGSNEFQKFVENGLLEIETDSSRARNLIIAVHVYYPETLAELGKVFNRYRQQLARKVVWVTETGVNNPSEHVKWVSNFYSQIIHTLNPEMICWYVLYGGEPSSDSHNGHGLISNVDSGLPVEERELFSKLTGVTE